MRTIALALLSLVAASALAHHSAAIYDSTKTVRLEGSIERYEWANPHVYIHLASSSGTWLVEAGSPSMMERVGWTSDTFVVEHFELFADRTTLAYRFTLEDPEYLAAPLEGSAVWEHRPDLAYTAEKCSLENARRYLEQP
jgi:hypothetical protein